MPLTRRTNGSSSSNIIQASWFNDFMDLFTGVMTDQPITFATTIAPNALNIINAASGISLAGSSALYGDGSNNNISLVAPNNGGTGEIDFLIGSTKQLVLKNSGALNLIATQQGYLLNNTQVLYSDAANKNLFINNPNIGGGGIFHMLIGGIDMVDITNAGALNVLAQQQGYLLSNIQVLFADSGNKNLTINAPNVGGSGKMYFSVGGVIQMSIDTLGQLRTRGGDLVFNTTP